MSAEVTSPEELSFGAALAELETIVRALESGQLELEEGLARYERGVALLRACQDKLAAAKQRVTMLIGEIEGDDAAAEESAEQEGSNE